MRQVGTRDPGSPYHAWYRRVMKHVASSRAPELVRTARQAAELSQAQLARRAGLQQSHIAAIETGGRSLSEEMLARILRAAGYGPGAALRTHAAEVVRAGARHGMRRIRLFGSAARGTDTFDSDIDLLVDVEDDRSYFDVAGFVNEVEELTGFSVDVVVDGDRRPGFLEPAELVAL